jgi:hypothetical protein
MTRRGPDFVEETQARSNTCEHVYFSKMGLLECLAESMGEAVEEKVDPSKIWRSLSLAQRRIFAQKENPETYGEDVPEGGIDSLDLEPGPAYMPKGGILSDPPGGVLSSQQQILVSLRSQTKR